MLLNKLIKYYVNKLKDKKSCISATDHNILFPSDIHAILYLNETLLKDLNKVISSNLFDIDTTEIGSIIVGFCPHFKMYTNYLNNYSKAIKQIQKLRKTNKSFNKYCDKQMNSSNFNGLSLEALIVLPIQRMPRYKMMLQEIIKYTNTNHPDLKSLNASLQYISTVNATINENMKEYDTRLRVQEIQNRFNKSLSINLVSSSRIFIKQGVLSKLDANTGDGVEYLFILFNDCLLYATESVSGGKLAFGNILHFNNTFNIHESPKEYNLILGIPNLFQIYSFEESMFLYASAKKIMNEWINIILKTFNDYMSLRTTQKKLKKRVSIETIYNSPLFFPTEFSDVCMISNCNNKFNKLLTRKHHCYHCGLVVCGHCSKNNLPPRGAISFSTVRVCDKCYQLNASEMKIKPQKGLLTNAKGIPTLQRIESVFEPSVSSSNPNSNRVSALINSNKPQLDHKKESSLFERNIEDDLFPKLILDDESDDDQIVDINNNNDKKHIITITNMDQLPNNIPLQTPITPVTSFIKQNNGSQLPDDFKIDDTPPPGSNTTTPTPPKTDPIINIPPPPMPDTNVPPPPTSDPANHVPPPPISDPPATDPANNIPPPPGTNTSNTIDLIPPPQPASATNIPPPPISNNIPAPVTTMDKPPPPTPPDGYKIDQMPPPIPDDAVDKKKDVDKPVPVVDNTVNADKPPPPPPPAVADKKEEKQADKPKKPKTATKKTKKKIKKVTQPVKPKKEKQSRSSVTNMDIDDQKDTDTVVLKTPTVDYSSTPIRERIKWVREMTKNLPSPTATEVIKWGPTEVGKFISCVPIFGLNVYYGNRFKEMKVNGVMFLKCTEQSLIDWGIEKKCHRSRFRAEALSMTRRG